RFPEKFDLHYDNSARSFRENVHSGKWIFGIKSDIDDTILFQKTVDVFA
ncbi:13256_t:CDS:1, partial [Funneliformis mosseae]